MDLVRFAVYQEEEYGERVSEDSEETYMDGASEMVADNFTKEGSPILRAKYKHMDDNTKCCDHNHDRERTQFELIKYEDLPPYLTGNEYLLHGYRANFSWSLCVQSILRHHNETLNIWTHLLGTVLFVVLMVLVLCGEWGLEDPTAQDKLVFSVFFLGAICQMAFSTIYHIFCCHSDRYYLWFMRLDYVGISMMIVGSYFPCIYYTMRCDPHLYTVHLTLISVLGVVGVVVTAVPIFSSPKFRTVRVLFFVIFALYILIPLPNIIMNYGFQSFWPLLWRLLIMAALYLTGAVIYATRAPECCAPGRFDMGWYSHPIWHLFTVAAAIVQMYNCLYAYEHHKAVDCSLLGMAMAL